MTIPHVARSFLSLTVSVFLGLGLSFVGDLLLHPDDVDRLQKKQRQSMASVEALTTRARQQKARPLAFPLVTTATANRSPLQALAMVKTFSSFTTRYAATLIAVLNRRPGDRAIHGRSPARCQLATKFIETCC